MTDSALRILTIGKDSDLLARLYQALEHHTVTSVAPNADASALAEQHRADMIIVHVNDDDSVDLAVSLALTHEGTPLFVLDDHPEDEMGRVLIKAGARGYASAGLEPEVIAGAVGDIMNGELWMPRSVMQSMMHELTAENEAGQGHEDPRLGLLTKREREVVQLVAKGASNKDVADQLGLTVRTVKAHMTSAFQKTGTSARLELSLLVRGELPLKTGLSA
ncbi:MAG: helix-turn-helix transcriptional regulator [Litorivicinus sp.]